MFDTTLDFLFYMSPPAADYQNGMRTGGSTALSSLARVFRKWRGPVADGILLISQSLTVASPGCCKSETT